MTFPLATYFKVVVILAVAVFSILVVSSSF